MNQRISVAHAKRRDVAVDMLRVLACCAVVGLHTFSRGMTPLAFVLRI